jgi:hypothetical protein
MWQWVREFRAWAASAGARTYYPLIGFLTGLSVWICFLFVPKIQNPLAAWLGLFSGFEALSLFVCCKFRHGVDPPRGALDQKGSQPGQPTQFTGVEHSGGDSDELDYDGQRAFRFLLRADPSRRWAQLLPVVVRPWEAMFAKVVMPSVAVLGLVAMTAFCIVGAINAEPAKAQSSWVKAVWCWMVAKVRSFSNLILWFIQRLVSLRVLSPDPFRPARRVFLRILVGICVVSAHAAVTHRRRRARPRFCGHGPLIR